MKLRLKDDQYEMNTIATDFQQRCAMKLRLKEDQYEISYGLFIHALFINVPACSA